MYSIEKKIIHRLKENMNILFFIAISLLGILARYVGRDMQTNDMEAFLIPWFNEVSKNGGIKGLHIQVGDYNVLYQTIISIMTYIKMNSIYQYKILSCVFDYLLAFGCSYLLSELTGLKKWGHKFNLIYAAILLLPTIVFNSAFWGQCDAIYTFFVIATLFCMYKKKYVATFAFFGIALAFKLQAIFILPFIICYYLYKEEFSISLFGVALFTFWFSGVVAYAFGANPLQPFIVYMHQTTEYPRMYLNISSFWMLVGDNWEYLHRLAILVTLCLCGIGLYVILSKKIALDLPEPFLYTATWFVWTCILFLPAMHERYTYPLDILLILLTFMNKKYIKYAALSFLLSLITYGQYLFGNGGVDKWHVLLYVAAWIYFTYEILKGEKLRTNED